jgi:hypothetical protein
MQYYTTRAFPTASRQYEAGDAIDPTNITAAEWIKGTESGAVVPARWYGTAAELAARGIPGPGVPVYETDTKIARVGDGTTAVASLPQVGSATYGRIASEAIPRSRRLWMVGDSITDNGNPGGLFGGGRLNGLAVFNSQSIIGAALANLDGRVRHGGVAATGGYTAEQIRTTHVPTIIANASRGDIVAVLAGTNNEVAGDLAATKMTLLGIYADLEAAGLLPLPCTVPPNKNPANYVAFSQALNAFVQRNAAEKGYSVADFYSVTVDTATNSYLAAYDSGDNTHPSAAGAWAMGVELARAVRVRVPACTPGVLYTTNAYPSGLLHPTNSVMLTDTNSDGIPDFWGLLSSAGTSTKTLTTDAAYIGKKFTITRGDTNINVKTGAFTLVPGNRVLFGVKFTATPAASGTWSIRLENVGGSGAMAGYASIPTVSGTASVVLWDFVVPAGWPTYSFRVDIYANTGVGTALEVGQVTVRDLTAEGIA